jgi:hypothetical protein
MILTALLAITLNGPLHAQSNAKGKDAAQAITQLQKTPTSMLDARLPRQQFSLWLQKLLGTAAPIEWQISDCGAPSSTADDLNQELPTCVEAEATLTDGRTVVVVIDASPMMEKRGKPVVHWISVENKDGSTDVQSLRDLQVMLGMKKVK